MGWCKISLWRTRREADILSWFPQRANCPCRCGSSRVARGSGELYEPGRSCHPLPLTFRHVTVQLGGDNLSAPVFLLSSPWAWHLIFKAVIPFSTLDINTPVLVVGFIHFVNPSKYQLLTLLIFLLFFIACLSYLFPLISISFFYVLCVYSAGLFLTFMWKF